MSILTLFRLTPGVPLVDCPGVSAETMQMKLRVVLQSERIVSHAQPSPPPRPCDCISKNLELRLLGPRCGSGGLLPMPQPVGEVAVVPSTALLLLGTSVASSSGGRTLERTGCESTATASVGRLFYKTIFTKTSKISCSGKFFSATRWNLQDHIALC